MQVNAVMTRDVDLVGPNTRLKDAAMRMRDDNCGALPVGENDRLIGMVTDRDIAVRGVAEGKGPATPVSEVMTQDVKYCFEDEDTAHVIKNMGDLQVRRLPVVNRDKRLVGILSLADLANTERGQRIANALRDVVQPGGEHTQGTELRSGGM